MSARLPLKEQDIFSERYLLKRPLLEAISCTEQPVLLIDEVDRADEAFEAYLLELLSDFQMSIPELGTIRAVTKPLVVITSNGTRELSDALRRRCLYQYVDYPDFAKELAIVEIRAPQSAGQFARQVVDLCRPCGAWICKKSRASPRRSIGPRPCSAWEFPRSMTTARSASSKP
jgi:MoxR-like ATPase